MPQAFQCFGICPTVLGKNVCLKAFETKVRVMFWGTLKQRSKGKYGAIASMSLGIFFMRKILLLLPFVNE